MNYSIFAVGAKNDSVKRHGWFLREVNDEDLYHSPKDGFVKPPTHPSTKRAYTPPCNPPTAAKAGIFFTSVSFLSVSRFQEKEKRGEMITINDNIK